MNSLCVYQSSLISYVPPHLHCCATILESFSSWVEDRHKDFVNLFVVNKETWFFLCVSSLSFFVHISFLFACNLSLSLVSLFVCLISFPLFYYFSFYVYIVEIVVIFWLFYLKRGR